MPAAPHGCGNDTSLPTCCKLHTCHLLHGVSYSEPASPSTSCVDEESSGSLAVIIIPCLLAVGTVVVVALIFYSLHKNKQRVQSTATHITNGMNCFVSSMFFFMNAMKGADLSLVVFFSRPAECNRDCSFCKHS